MSDKEPTEKLEILETLHLYFGHSEPGSRDFNQKYFLLSDFVDRLSPSMINQITSAIDLKAKPDSFGIYAKSFSKIIYLLLEKPQVFNNFSKDGNLLQKKLDVLEYAANFDLTLSKYFPSDSRAKRHCLMHAGDYFNRIAILNIQIDNEDYAKVCILKANRLLGEAQILSRQHKDIEDEFESSLTIANSKFEIAECLLQKYFKINRIFKAIPEEVVQEIAKTSSYEQIFSITNLIVEGTLSAIECYYMIDKVESNLSIQNTRNLERSGRYLRSLTTELGVQGLTNFYRISSSILTLVVRENNIESPDAKALSSAYLNSLSIDLAMSLTMLFHSSKPYLEEQDLNGPYSNDSQLFILALQSRLDNNRLIVDNWRGTKMFQDAKNQQLPMRKRLREILTKIYDGSKRHGKINNDLVQMLNLYEDLLSLWKLTSEKRNKY